jgi:hypothetical protein
MNRLSSLLLLCGLSIAVTTPAADGNQCPPPSDTLFQVRVFTLPKEEGLALLAKDLDDQALHMQLMEAARKTPAILEKLLLVTSDSHCDVDLRLADELRYPTEFDPQQLPQKIAIGDAALIRAVDLLLQPKPEPDHDPEPPPAKADAKASPPAEAPRHPVNGGLGVITSIVPTAFEMRALGDHLALMNVETTDDGALAMNLSLECTRLSGFDEFNGEMQAQFSNRTITSKVVVHPSKPCLLGTLSTAQRTGSNFQNTESTVSIAFLTAHTSPTPAPKPQAQSNPDSTLSAQFEVFSLTKQDAVALIDANISDTALRERLQASLKAGQARLESWMTGGVNSDGRGMLQEFDEYIFATQYDPPQCPQEIVIADDALLADLRAGRQVGTGVAPPADVSTTNNGGFGLQTSPTPTHFEMRELGTKLEIDVTRAGSYLTVRAKPQISRLIGERQYTGTTQPVFGSQSLDTTTTVQLGVPRLLGTLSRPLNTGIKEGNQEDRVWFAFLTLRE